MKEINKKAWQIRREAAKKYDCKVMEISWRECFAAAKTIVLLIEDGGRIWEKGKHRRIYGLNPRFFGLAISYYGSGSIKAASLKGEHISNNKAHKMANAIENGYYDLNNLRFSF